MHRAFRAGLLEVRSMAQVREQIGLKPGSEPDETKHYTRVGSAQAVAGHN